MLRRLGLAISYFIATVYFLAILLPSIYCLRHGCKGPGEGDAFMPAFALIPIGGIATAFALVNAIQQIRKRHSWSWVFWVAAIVFAILLLATLSVIALVIYFTAFHRR
ncbi:MAG TPA: hypothetical protein VKB40_04185 [Candidatus Acidoferrales bacterium]|jgi:hypothetical protein|nr:hypothetical protein [Candidatus Acidoferrales bacterium]